VWGRRSRWIQLSKMKLNRTVLSYAYLVALATCVVILNLTSYHYSSSHPDSIVLVAYLALITVLMNIPEVRLDRGRLTMSGLVNGTTAALLNPLDATIVLITTALALGHRGAWRIMGNACVYALAGCLAAVVASHLRIGGNLSLGARGVVQLIITAANLTFVSTAISIRTGEPVISVLRQNFNASFYLSFVYFALGAILMSYVLDGSLTGYLLGTIVCVLSLALTDTIAGRRVRRVLESELSDADRHLFHSRAVEGVVHNLRNHMATAQAYLKEVNSGKLDEVDRESLETAKEAADDAVTVLHSLAQGATPKVSYAPNPVDLNELVTRAAGMARPRARTKEVQLAIRESAADVKVRADPLLMREVMTNLLNNAIDAAPNGGRVEIATGRRGNGWPYVSVGDNGPGVPDDHRHHLFEPHFTTKEGGTGLGLFMSYGIVREHQGNLNYEGSRRGAVFTVALPPFDSQRALTWRSQ
jgi:signal transduction histidine kinase